MPDEDREKSTEISISVLDTKAVAKAVDKISSFLGTVFGPAAHEFSLLLQQQFAYYRYKNLLNIVDKTEKLRAANPDLAGKVIHPRLIYKAMELGSWADDDEVHQLWAGLLASSSTEDGKDQSNLIFMNLLDQMTSSEVKILTHVCASVKFETSPHGLVTAKETVTLTTNQLTAITGEQDIIQLDRDLDHLNTLGLLEGVFDAEDDSAPLWPTALAINLYVRGAQASRLAPVDYFKLR